MPWLNEDQLNQIEPITPPRELLPTDAPVEEFQPGFGDYVSDVFMGAGTGVVKSLAETGNFVHDVANAADNYLFDDQYIDNEKLFDVESGEYKTAAGGVAEGMSQFVTAFVGAGKFLKAAQWANKLRQGGKLAQFGHATAQGAIADFVAFDPQEGRFSNMLKDAGVDTAVTDYLAADGDDGEIEGRFKNALEGAALGGMLEPVFMAFRGIKKAATAGKAGDERAVVEALEKGGEELEHLTGETELKFRPEEEVEVYSALAPEGVAKKIADEHGVVLLEDGESFIKDKQPIPLREEVDTDVEALAKIGEGDVNAIADVDPDQIYRVRNITTTEQIAAATAKFGEATSHVWEKGTVSHEMMEEQGTKIAESMAESPEAIHQYMTEIMNTADSLETAYATLHGVTKFHTKLTGDITKVAQQVLRDGSQRKMGELLDLVRLNEQFSANINRVKSGTGRLLNSMQVPVKPLHQLDDLAEISSHIKELGGHQKVLELAEKLATSPSAQATSSMLKNKGMKGFINIHNEYWVNGILSGPKTHMVNMMSNMINTFILPAEKMVGGALSLDSAPIKEGLRTYVGLFTNFTDSLKWAGMSLKRGHNIIDEGHRIFDGPEGAISARAQDLSESSPLGIALDAIGKVARIPTRFLSAEDEFFKQLNYRAKLHADLVGRAVDMHGFKGEAVGRYVADNFDKGFTKDGTGTYKDALEYGREATFTKELGYGASQKLQNLAQSFPAFRMVMPFIRTPANITRQLWQRTPILGTYQRQLATDLASNDAAVRAAARGKQAVGSMIWGSAVMLAMNGRITGSGPKDAKQRKLWLEENTPYSVVMDDGTTISYDRLDPFGMIVGIAADYAEISKYSDDSGDMAMGMITALVKNMTSKTYLSGLVDLINAISDPERYGPSFFQRQAASRVPFSGALGQARQEIDPAMREVRGVMDAVMNKIPGLSENLAVKRSWITGDEVMYPDTAGYIPDIANPIRKGTKKNSMVIQELLRLSHGFQPPIDEIDGVELTGEQYSRYLQLHGTLRLSNRTMYEELERVMGTSSYDINRERYPDAPTDDIDDPRLKKINRIITRYRRAAKAQLKREDADLGGKLDEAHRRNVSHRRQYLEGIIR